MSDKNIKTDPCAMDFSGNTGLTKLEYFAACALHGLCAVPLDDYVYSESPEVVAVQIADGLINALNKGEDNE